LFFVTNGMQPFLHEYKEVTKNMKAVQLRAGATTRTLEAITAWLQGESSTARTLMGGESVSRMQVIRLYLTFIFIIMSAAAADVLALCGMFVALAAWMGKAFVENTPEGKEVRK